MSPRPPNSTLTYPLFPYTTLFRSHRAHLERLDPGIPARDHLAPIARVLARFGIGAVVLVDIDDDHLAFVVAGLPDPSVGAVHLRNGNREDRKSKRLNSSQ